MAEAQQTTPSISSIFGGALNTGVGLLGQWGASKIRKDTAPIEQAQLGAEAKIQQSKTLTWVIGGVVGLLLIWGAMKLFKR